MQGSKAVDGNPGHGCSSDGKDFVLCVEKLKVSIGRDRCWIAAVGLAAQNAYLLVGIQEYRHGMQTDRFWNYSKITGSHSRNAKVILIVIYSAEGLSHSLCYKTMEVCLQWISEGHPCQSWTGVIELRRA